MKKRREKQNWDRHHIIPTSRGGSNNQNNILRVSRKQHQAWHLLFGNMLQDEVIMHIIYYWYQGKISPRMRLLFRAYLEE